MRSLLFQQLGGDSATRRIGMTPEDVLQFARERGVKMVDFKFVDVPGTWQHFSVPLRELEENTFIEGKPFDGSSIRGFQTIDESDMLIFLIPTLRLWIPSLPYQH